MTNEPPQLLSGKRVLVVEDEPTLAFVLKAMLEEAGGTVVGPANSLSSAFNFLDSSKVDCAIMDIRLNNETVFSFAMQLVDKEIPFAFVTGNSGKTLPEELKTRPLLLKPVSFDQLISVIVKIIH